MPRASLKVPSPLGVSPEGTLGGESIGSSSLKSEPEPPGSSPPELLPDCSEPGAIEPGVPKVGDPSGDDDRPAESVPQPRARTPMKNFELDDTATSKSKPRAKQPTQQNTPPCVRRCARNETAGCAIQCQARQRRLAQPRAAASFKLNFEALTRVAARSRLAAQ